VKREPPLTFDERAGIAAGFGPADVYLGSLEAPPIITPELAAALDALAAALDALALPPKGGHDA
jgi:hypothetical protein